MSMKGDLPGLSNLGPGTIGSCQYSTRLPLDGSTSPALGGDAFAAADGAERVAFEAATMPEAFVRPRSTPASNAAYATSARTTVAAPPIANARRLIRPPRSRLAPLRCPARGSNERLGAARRRSSRALLGRRRA